MAERTVELGRQLEAGAEAAVTRLAKTFSGWETPRCYLQFGDGFALDGLFDGPAQTLPLAALPGMPAAANPDGGHPAWFYGHCQGVPLLVLGGHRQMVEGLGPYPCLLPVTTAWKLGIARHVHVACGLSLISEVKAGSWLLLTDYVNAYAVSPLEGVQHLLADNYPDLGNALSQLQNAELVNALAAVDLTPKLGTYYAHPGRHICTPAEAALARLAGCELAGHDLVMEVILAHALGCEVSALVLAGARVPERGRRQIRRGDMLSTCRFCSELLMRGLRLAIPRLVEAETAFGPASLPEADTDALLWPAVPPAASGQPPKLRLQRRE